MAAFNKFECFVGDLAIGKDIDLNVDQLECYLASDAPSASADSIKTDLAEITIENGYTGPEDTTNTASETAGVLSCIGQDIVITASGGTVGPFQYTVLFDTTPTDPLDPLTGWWDYGSAVTLQNNETFTINFGTEMFTIE